MPTLNPDTLWQWASRRWAEIAAISPDLAPALALQQRLVRLLLDHAARLDQPVPDTLSRMAIDDRWRRGVPALRNQQVPIPDSLKEAVPSFCNAIAEGGAGDSVLHIRDAVIRGDIDAGSLLSVSLARNRKAIRTSSLHMGFSPDLIWLIGELASSPLAYHLHRQVLDIAGPVDEWDRGYCAICGSWPVFIEVVAGRQTLRCSYCALAWSLTSRRCVYCGNTDDDFLAAAPDPSDDARRVDLCGRCGNYTKVITVLEATPFPLLAIEDLASMDLDHAAMMREYRRPDLYDLESLEPLKSNC